MENIAKPITFKSENKIINIYPAIDLNAPVIYFNSYSDNGDEELLNILSSMDVSPFTLITISGLDWNRDMSPWFAPPLFKGDLPCTGGAKEYLKFLTEEIVPKAESNLKSMPKWRGIAGYSLAGLFTVYALYNSAIFSRYACISSSFWFPNFIKYIQTHTMPIMPEYVYISLGDKEANTKNLTVQTVLLNTEKIYTYFINIGIPVIFKLNPGGHFDNPAKRCASGIYSIVTYNPKSEGLL